MPRASADDRGRLHELIGDFRTAMLVTCSPSHQMEARPLTIADISDDGLLYFPTGADTGTVAAIGAVPQVNVSMQGKAKFVSLTATARVSRDPGLIARLWSDAWKVWFPGGQNDPNLVILVIDPHRAEFWDESGGKGISYLFNAARAVLSGTTSDPDPDAHGEVNL